MTNGKLDRSPAAKNSSTGIAGLVTQGSLDRFPFSSQISLFLSNKNYYMTHLACAGDLAEMAPGLNKVSEQKDIFQKSFSWKVIDLSNLQALQHYTSRLH